MTMLWLESDFFTENLASETEELLRFRARSQQWNVAASLADDRELNARTPTIRRSKTPDVLFRIRPLSGRRSKCVAVGI